MPKKYLTSINLSQNELQNAKVQNLASDPSSPTIGQVYFNTGTGKLRTYNGTTWDEMGTSTAAGDVTGQASSVDSEVALFSGTSGKVIKRATGSGLAKLTSGVLSTATAGTDYSAGTSALGTGILRTTTSTGELTVAVAADFPTLNQNTTGTASNVTGTVAIANGGTGQTTRQAALNGLSATSLTGTSGQVLRSDGTNVSVSAIQAGDVPTLNQNTTGTASNVTGTVAIANGGTGVATLPSGLLKGAGTGAITAATAGTDYVTGASTNTFTNKTFDANGTGNTLSNVEVADFASAAVNTSTTLASASNTQFPTALAVKSYADALIGAADAMVYKGAIDASTNPNFPAGVTGDTYKISVSGKIGGASGVTVTAGDMIIASADNAGGTQASVGASWNVIQANVDLATDSAAGLVELATVTESEAKSSSSVAVTPAGLATFTRKFSADIGTGAATSIAVTHNLGTKDVIAQVREVSGDAVVECDIVSTSTTVTTFTFGTAPATNSLRVVIQG